MAPATVNIFVDSSQNFHGAVAARLNCSGAMHEPHWRMCLTVSSVEHNREGVLEDADIQSRELLGTARAVREYLRSHAAEDLSGTAVVVHNDNQQAADQLNDTLHPPDAILVQPRMQGPGVVATGEPSGKAGTVSGTRRVNVSALRKHRVAVAHIVNGLRGNVRRVAEAGGRACQQQSTAAAAAAATARTLKRARLDVQRAVAAGAAAGDAAVCVEGRGEGMHAAITAGAHEVLAQQFTAAADAIAQASASTAEAAEALEAMHVAATAVQAEAARAMAAAVTVSTAGRAGMKLRRAIEYGSPRVDVPGEGARGSAGGWDAAVAEVDAMERQAIARGVVVSGKWLPRKSGLMPKADKLSRPWDGDDWALCRAAAADNVRAALVREGLTPPPERRNGAAPPWRLGVSAALARLSAALGWAGAAQVEEAPEWGAAAESAAVDGPVRARDEVMAAWGVTGPLWPPDVDLFASEGTNHASLYYAAVWDGGCAGVDAFKHDWSQWPQAPGAVATAPRGGGRPPLCYAFPPVQLLPQTLAKVKEDRAVVWLAVPGMLPRALKLQMAALPVQISFPLGGRLKRTVRATDRNKAVDKDRVWKTPLHLCLVSGWSRAGEA